MNYNVSFYVFPMRTDKGEDELSSEYPKMRPKHHLLEYPEGTRFFWLNSSHISPQKTCIYILYLLMYSPGSKDASVLCLCTVVHWNWANACSGNAFLHSHMHMKLCTWAVKKQNAFPIVFEGAESESGLRFINFQVEQYVPGEFRCFPCFPTLSAHWSKENQIDWSG
jgi:hypothetical protein